MTDVKDETQGDDEAQFPIAVFWRDGGEGPFLLVKGLGLSRDAIAERAGRVVTAAEQIVNNAVMFREASEGGLAHAVGAFALRRVEFENAKASGRWVDAGAWEAELKALREEVFAAQRDVDERREVERKVQEDAESKRRAWEELFGENAPVLGAVAR